MKIGIIFLICLPFLPGLLLPPDIVYPTIALQTDIGEIRASNTVLQVKSSNNLLHQIDVVLKNDDLLEAGCRPVATRMDVSSSEGVSATDVFKLWRADDEDNMSRGQVALVTANYISSPLSELQLDLNVLANPECNIEFNENIKLQMKKKSRRWWPWNIVADLIYSV